MPLLMYPYFFVLYVVRLEQSRCHLQPVTLSVSPAAESNEAKLDLQFLGCLVYINLLASLI